MSLVHEPFINGLLSLEVKQRLRIPPQPGYFREAIERAMSLTAAIYQGDQILKQKSMAWKMAASASNPLNIKLSTYTFKIRIFLESHKNLGKADKLWKIKKILTFQEFLSLF